MTEMSFSSYQFLLCLFLNVVVFRSLETTEDHPGPTGHYDCRELIAERGPTLVDSTATLVGYSLV